MRPPTFLVVSLALNMALTAALGFVWFSDVRNSGAPIKPAVSPKNALTIADLPGDPAQVFAWAKQGGVSDELAYHFALGAAQISASVAAPYEYWKPAPERSEVQRGAAYKSVQAIRELLLSSFGPAARNQLAFAEVFQPYRSRFPFLSSEKQMALQRILFDAEGSGTGLIGPVSTQCSGSCDKRTAKIRELLSAEELAEYQRRESPVAVRLANNGFEFTEKEFRAVYDALAAAEQESTAAAPVQGWRRDEGETPLVLLPTVERLLGSARFLEFKHAQNPIYRWLRLGARDFDVPLQTVDAAYELISAAERKASAILRAPGAGTDVANARAEIFAARDRELKSKLGAELFEYIAPRLAQRARSRPAWAGSLDGAFIPAR